MIECVMCDLLFRGVAEGVPKFVTRIDCFYIF